MSICLYIHTFIYIYIYISICYEIKNARSYEYVFPDDLYANI